jgi:hypothetical protein
MMHMAQEKINRKKIDLDLITKQMHILDYLSLVPSMPALLQRSMARELVLSNVTSVSFRKQIYNKIAECTSGSIAVFFQNTQFSISIFYEFQSNFVR